MIAPRQKYIESRKRQRANGHETLLISGFDVALVLISWTFFQDSSNCVQQNISSRDLWSVLTTLYRYLTTGLRRSLT